MKTLAASIFAAASMAVLPMPAAVALDVAKVTCGPDVPEEWKRAGGYCEKIEGGGSLSGFVDCEVILPARLELELLPTDGIEVASLADFADESLPTDSGFLVAVPYETNCGEGPR